VRQKTRAKKLQIWSDSQAAIAAIYSRSISSKLVLEIKELIQDLGASSGLDIAINWVKGHANNTGNELADMLAKKGAELNGICHSASPSIPISTRVVKNEIAKSIDTRWQKSWSAPSSCRQKKLNERRRGAAELPAEQVLHPMGGQDKN
jgi:hypothetical protein